MRMGRRLLIGAQAKPRLKNRSCRGIAAVLFRTVHPLTRLLKPMRVACRKVLEGIHLYDAYEDLVFRWALRGKEQHISFEGAEATVLTPTHAEAVLAGNFLKNEAHLLEFCFRTLCPRDIVWDIGANLGLFSILCAQRVGPEGAVFSFEPEPETFRKLQRNVQRNQLKQINPVPCALSDQNGSADLFSSLDKRHIGTHSFVRREDYSQKQQGTSVSVTRGDTWLREGCFPVPALIKIDVEGFELFVVKGLSGILSEPALRAVCIELHPPLILTHQDPEAALIALLSPHGFELAKRIPRGSEIHCYFTRLCE